MAIIGLGRKVLGAAISSIFAAEYRMYSILRDYRRVPNQVLEARVKKAIKDLPKFPILWGLYKTAVELSILVEEGRGKISISEIENARVRKALKQEGIEQINLRSYSKVDSLHMLIILMRAVAGMKEGLSHTYRFQPKNLLSEEIIQLTKERSVIEVRRWLVEEK